MVCCSITDLRNKQVINAKNGERLGFVSDVEIDCQKGCLVSIIIWGKIRIFGRREDDIRICWKDISVIGDDTILVCGCERVGRQKNGMFDGIFK